MPTSCHAPYPISSHPHHPHSPHYPTIPPAIVYCTEDAWHHVTTQSIASIPGWLGWLAYTSRHATITWPASIQIQIMLGQSHQTLQEPANHSHTILPFINSRNSSQQPASHAASQSQLSIHSHPHCYLLCQHDSTTNINIVHCLLFMQVFRN